MINIGDACNSDRSYEPAAEPLPKKDTSLPSLRTCVIVILWLRGWTVARLAYRFHLPEWRVGERLHWAPKIKEVLERLS